MKQIWGIIIITCGFLCEREVFDQNAHKTTNNFISNDQSDAEIKGTFGIIMIAKNRRSRQTDASFYVI